MAVIPQMPPVEQPPPIAAAAVVERPEPPQIVAGAVVEPPPIAAEAVVETVVEPPPVAADAVAERPPPIAEDAVETVVGTPPPAAAEDEEAAAPASMSVAPPLPPERTVEQKIQSAMDAGEEPLPSEIQKVIESIEVQLPSLADDQKPCDMTIQKQPEETVQPSEHLLVEEQPAMVVSDNNSKESEKQITTQLCPSGQQQIPMLECAGSEESQEVSPMNSSMVSTKNHPPSSTNLSDNDGLSDDDSDYSEDGYHSRYDSISHWRNRYYRLMRGNYGYPCIGNARRNRWHSDHDFIRQCDPMASFDTEPWSHWPSPEPGIGKERHNVTSADTRYVSRWSPPGPVWVKERYKVGAGLSNPHWWTCFLNCILQCMVHTVPLVLRLRKADHPDPCPCASGRFCCFCSLKLHADESIRLSGSAFYPESFVNHLKSISSNFESGVQQDAQEFLCDLLEKLDEASSSTEEGGIAKEIFGGRLKSQLRCPECSRCSDKSEPFLDLSLEVTMVESLTDALQSFTKVELIEDFMCDGCKSRVNMEKHFKVEQAPEVLVIHLKRFTNSGGKICDKVKYPLVLDINSFMSSSDNTQQQYDLYGVVVHHGIYGRGHYVCYIRSSVDDWYEFNDDKIFRCSEASVLDSAAYLLFYVKQGSSPWFSTLLEKEDKFQQDGSVSLAEQGASEIALIGNKEEKLTEQGASEIALIGNKEEKSTSSGNSGYCLLGPAEENGNMPSLSDFSQDIQLNVGNSGYCLLGPAEENGNMPSLSDFSQDIQRNVGNSGYCLLGPAEENGNMPSLSDFSQDIQWNGNDNALPDAADKLEEGCCLGGISVGTQELSRLIGSDDKNAHADEFLELWEEEDVRPRGSLDTEEMNPSTHRSSEVDPAEPHGGSPPKSENIYSLVQLSHYDDKPWEKEDDSPKGSLDTKEMNPITHGSLEVGPAVTRRGSLPKREIICSLLHLAHMYDDKPLEKEDVSPSGSLETKEMNPSTHGSSEVEPTVTHGGSPPKNENFCSLLQQSLKHDDNYHSRNFSSQDETGGSSGAPSMGTCTSENETLESKSNHEFQDSKDDGSGWGEGGGGGKRKSPSSADTDSGGGGEWKTSRKRRNYRTIARYFDLCRRRVWAAAAEKSTKDDDGN